MSGSRFLAKYRAAAQRNNTLLCVGLDPDPARLPDGVDSLTFLREIVAATADLVCCYKPNAAFFEAEGPSGVEVLRELIAAIPDDVPVLLDAKRGDVGNSAAMYARAVFEALEADAVTVSPYLGGDALEPFLAYEDRHSFVLCRTSNPGAGEFQDLAVGPSGQPLYLEVADRANGWNSRGNVGLVVGATYPDEARAIRERCPDLPFLMPGVGAQEGDLEAAVQAAQDLGGGGFLVNASRGVLYAEAGPRYAGGARDAAEALRLAINGALGDNGVPGDGHGPRSARG